MSTQTVSIALKAIRPKRTRSKALFARLCAVVLALYVAIAVIGPSMVSFDPAATDLENRLLPPGAETSNGSVAVFGTDQLGQDILAQVINGARTSLIVSLLAVTLAMVVGTFVGILAGYVGGKLDAILMRIVDIQMAFPTILLAILVAGVLGQSVLNVVIALAIANWIVYARVLRSQVLTIKGREFVEATRALGAGHWHILRRCIAPGCSAPILVIATVDIGAMILAEASLSFLGLGVPAGTVSWGRTIFNGQNFLDSAWWISAIPGLALTVVVVALGFVGDYLRDRTDPRAVK